MIIPADFFKKNLSFFIALIIIAILISLVIESYYQISILRQENKDQQVIFEQKTKALINIEDIKKEYNILAEEKNRIEVISYEKQIQFLLKEMDPLISRSGLVLKNIVFQEKIIKEDDENLIYPLSFNINIVGTYISLKNLIKTLETNYPLINIVRLSYEDKLSEKIINFNLELRTYYQ